MTLDDKARALWDAAPSRAHCPAWDQLGEVTKDVWRARVLREEFGDLA